MSLFDNNIHKQPLILSEETITAALTTIVEDSIKETSRFYKVNDFWPGGHRAFVSDYIHQKFIVELKTNIRNNIDRHCYNGLLKELAGDDVIEVVMVTPSYYANPSNYEFGFSVYIKKTIIKYDLLYINVTKNKHYESV